MGSGLEAAVYRSSPLTRGARRTALFVVAAEMLPVPLLDTWLQNAGRRHHARVVADRLGAELPEATLRELCDDPVLDPKRLLLWPVKKLFSTAFLAIGVVSMAREAQRVLTLADRVSERVAPEPKSQS